MNNKPHILPFKIRRDIIFNKTKQKLKEAIWIDKVVIYNKICQKNVSKEKILKGRSFSTNTMWNISWVTASAICLINRKIQKNLDKDSAYSILNKIYTIIDISNPNPVKFLPKEKIWSFAMSQSRVYADVNVQRPRDYWDYESLTVQWGYNS